ncbi:DUF3093 domain-containing protein [uncultured Jatrophihabitans sp.]|uniref:DUF3093 domain-containing protein n=1 Tax=uncultured Jatrophihabitans sp. TaxID=1610747 RepID=UPI0035CB4A41
MSAGTDSPHGAVYRETLRTPWWWYVVALAVAALLAAEFHIPGVRLTDWIPWCSMPPLALIIVWWLGRSHLEVRDHELRVRGAHLPLGYVTGEIALDQQTLRRIVGREGDPAAFVSVRPWIGPGVQLWIDDEEDPTPYWLVSSRHPDRLVAAVRSAR